MSNTTPTSRGKRRRVYLTPKGLFLSRPQVAFLRKRLFGRKHQWLTQRDLADLIGVSEQELGRVERGLRRPSFELLFLLAAALYQPPHQLYPEIWQKARETVDRRRNELGIGTDEQRSI